jgi:hypothetical protein
VRIDKLARPRLRRARAWAWARLPELAILLVGVALRLTMATGFDVRAGFDFPAHWGYITYVTEHHALPSLMFNTASYHPPLYYVITALLIAAGFGPGALGWLAALLGIARLAIVWAGLERWLPESRLARCCALAAAAVLPASVQLDGMITNETLFALLAALVLLVAPKAVLAIREGRLAPVVTLAILLGLAFLTKVSASVFLLAIVAVVVIEIARAPRPLAALRARARPLIVGAALVSALAGWFFVRNQVLYGKPAPTGYDGWAKAVQEPYEAIPCLDRRTLGFFVGFDRRVFADPYSPVGYTPQPRFLSVLLATTFVDYYNYQLARTEAPQTSLQRHWRSLPPRGVELAGWSVVGGAVLAVLTLLAWVAAWRRTWKDPADPRLVLLLAVALGLLGQLHFAVKYPNDSYGPIKGTYLQFVAPVAFGLYGLAVAWLWRRRWTRPGALIAMAALGLVLVYISYCRWPRERAGTGGAAPFWTGRAPPARTGSK